MRKTIFLFGVLCLLSLALSVQAFFHSETPSQDFTAPRSSTITLIDDTLHFVVPQTQAHTVRDLLATYAISLSEHDRVLPSLDSPLASGMTIYIMRAKNFSLVVDGTTLTRTTLQRSVQDAISESTVTLQPLDIVSPERTTPLQKNAVITITRVVITKEVVSQKIPFEKIETDDATLGWRERKIIQKGSVGERERTYDVYYHNGKEVDRRLLENVVRKEPVTEHAIQGTYIKLGKTHKGLGTWYSYTGTLAAASPWLPFGSFVKVTNTDNGKSVIVTINDRGPFGDNRIIDLDKVAFEKIASLGAGVINVTVKEILN